MVALESEHQAATAFQESADVLGPTTQLVAQGGTASAASVGVQRQ